MRGVEACSTVFFGEVAPGSVSFMEHSLARSSDGKLKNGWKFDENIKWNFAEQVFSCAGSGGAQWTLPHEYSTSVLNQWRGLLEVKAYLRVVSIFRATAGRDKTGQTLFRVLPSTHGAARKSF